MNFNQTKLENLKIEQIDDFVAMVKESYQQNNPFVASWLKSIEQLEDRIKSSVLLFLEAEKRFNEKYKLDLSLMKVLTHNGKMIAAGLSCDIHSSFQELITSIYGTDNPVLQVFKCLNPSAYPPGTALYSSLVCVKKEYMKLGVGIYFILQIFNYFKDRGVKEMFGISVNPIIQKMFLSIGGRRLSQVFITKNGATLRCAFLVNDITKITHKQIKSNL